MKSPYAYVTSGGVSNTRVRMSLEEATLEDLYNAARVPTQLEVAAITYHNGTKKERSNVKKELNYFIGGTFKTLRRDDANVQSRTLLTLDVEQGEDDATPPPDPRVVVERLAELGGCGWVYTSLSHTPKSPRYRVVLPLGNPVMAGPAAAATLKASTQAAAAKLGIEEWTKPESWVLSQPMYLPARLKGSAFFQEYRDGAAWRAVAGRASDGARGPGVPADIPDDIDPILGTLKREGMYLGEKRGHKGMHFITCPFHDQHENENDTQTVYYEAHHDGNPRPAVKCFDTAPDVDGLPHLTYKTLVRYLRKADLLAPDADDHTVLDDYEAFDRKSDMSRLLDGPAIPQQWSIEQFAPVGRVTVLAGPGGQGKSLAMLHVLIHLACGHQWGLFCTPANAPLRSLYISYEDGASQLQNRVQLIARHLGKEDDGTFDLLHDVQGQVRKNLRTYAADDDAAQWLLLNKPDRFGQPEATDRVEWLTGYLTSRKIKMLVLDPVVFTHQLNENDIADMATYMQTLGAIAKEAQCAIVVIHHMSKTGGFGIIDDINQNSLRGASSISDNARSVMAGINMPHLDCQQYGINPDERTQYFVAKHVKHNYSAPLPLQVFHNVGGVMVYRPEIRRMDADAVAEVKERSKLDRDNLKRDAQAVQVLECLDALTRGTSATVNQVIQDTGLQPRVLKTLPEWMEGMGWIHIEEGANRAKHMSILKEGRTHLKLLKLDKEK